MARSGVRTCPCRPPSAGFRPGAGTGGSLVAAIAPWASWRLAWPALPVVDGVQLVFIAGDGMPAKDRKGEPKRSYGNLSGGACLIGNPRPR